MGYSALAPTPRHQRSVALLAVVLAALNLRLTIVALSPILSEISGDISLSGTTLAVLAMLPPAGFAVFGVAGTGIATKIDLEATVMIAMFAAAAGHLLRAIAPSESIIIVGTLVSLAGMGVGNSLLPPLVKRYFPDHFGAVTALYLATVAISSTIPAVAAVPLAHTGGWRFSLGFWAVFGVLSFVALAPLFWMRHRNGHSHHTQFTTITVPKSVRISTLKSPITWSIAVIFSISTMNGYVMFAWLPKILADQAGVTATDAGLLLALFAGLSIPLAIVVPLILAKTGRSSIIITIGSLASVSGNLGLAFLSESQQVWVWVTLAGLGLLLFPACLTLINMKTKTEGGSAILSGLVQGIAYSIGLAGPLMFSLIHQVTAGWILPLVFLAIISITPILVIPLLGRYRDLEDAHERLELSHQSK